MITLKKDNVQYTVAKSDKRRIENLREKGYLAPGETAANSAEELEAARAQLEKERKELAAQKGQLTKERNAFEAEKEQATKGAK